MTTQEAHNLISKSMANYIFREVIEDMHSQLPGFTDEVMKKINIEVVNRCSAVLTILGKTKHIANFTYINIPYIKEWYDPEITPDIAWFLEHMEGEPGNGYTLKCPK